MAFVRSAAGRRLFPALTATAQANHSSPVSPRTAPPGSPRLNIQPRFRASVAERLRLDRPLPARYLNQASNLGIDFGRVVDGAGDFFPQSEPILLSQPMHRHFHGSLLHAQRLREIR